MRTSVSIVDRVETVQRVISVAPGGEGFEPDYCFSDHEDSYYENNIEGHTDLEVTDDLSHLPYMLYIVLFGGYDVNSIIR